MKKVLTKSVGVVLILLTLISTLTGCKFEFAYTIAPGYTGGFGIPYGSDQEYWWVNTYEECMDGVNQLKSHESTFISDYEILPLYEGDLFNVKYYFYMLGNLADKRAKYGDNPFDRRVNDVAVGAVIFLEDVEIDELVFKRIGQYNAYCFEPNHSLKIEQFEMISSDILECTLNAKGNYPSYEYRVKGQEDIIFALRAYNGMKQPTDEIIEAICNSIEIINHAN